MFAELGGTVLSARLYLSERSKATKEFIIIFSIVYRGYQRNDTREITLKKKKEGFERGRQSVYVCEK